MNIDALIDALRAEGEHETYPPASLADIEATEDRIQQPLPGSYKQFVSRFSNGAYLFGVQEVSAVGSTLTEEAARVPDRPGEAVSPRSGR